jgi:hypothetical protein
MQHPLMALIRLTLGSTLLASTGCNQSAEEAQKTAQQAQRQASSEIHDNNRAATKEIDEVKRAAAEKVAEAQQENRHENAEAQAEANVDIRKANLDVATDAAGLRLWGQKKIDGLNTRMDSARVKAQNATPARQTAFDAGMKSIQTRRDELAGEVATSEGAGMRKPDVFKTYMDTEVARLEARIDQLASPL